MGEAKTEAKLLRNASLERSIHAYMSLKQLGDNIKQDVVHALNASTLPVILATHTYGRQTVSYSTYEEMEHIIGKRRPFALVKMCESFAEKSADWNFGEAIMYETWMPGTPLKDSLIDMIVEKLRSVQAADIELKVNAQRTKGGQMSKTVLKVKGKRTKGGKRPKQPSRFTAAGGRASRSQPFRKRTPQHPIQCIGCKRWCGARVATCGHCGHEF